MQQAENNQTDYLHMMRCRVERLVDNYFNFNASTVDVRIINARHKKHYLRTSVSALELLKPASARRYQLHILPIAIDELSSRALDAILIHELAHVEGYLQGEFQKRSYGIIESALVYVVGGKSLARLERRIDMQVFVKAFDKATRQLNMELVAGLKEFRLWVYGKITSSQALAKKRFVYLTPEEIDFLQREILDDPAKLVSYVQTPPSLS
jgi:hypothetical protein